jgi:hypothetical protein
MSEIVLETAPSVDFLERTPLYDSQLVDEIFAPKERESVLETLALVHTAIQAARKGGVEESLIRDRVTQVFLSKEYAASALIKLKKTSIIADLSVSSLTQKMHGRQKTDLAAWGTRKVSDIMTGDILSNRKTSEEASVSVFNRLIIEKDARLSLHRMRELLSWPFPPDKSTVGFWEESAPDGTLGIGIHGLERTGVVGLRRNIADMQVLRGQPWKSPRGNHQKFVSSDSWMYTRPENIERMLGEPMEALEKKGLSWVGPVDIQKREDLTKEYLSGVTTLGRAVAAAVYAVPLRDVFIKEFIEYGKYPQIGSFVMPRSTFQNWQPQEAFDR